MEILQAHLDFFAAHATAIVLLSSFVEAVGIPFPGRIILIVAATLAPDARGLVALAAAAAVGSLLGDHVPYAAGYVMGLRLLEIYCRFALGSARCVAKTITFFRRFGAAAVLFARFSTTVRLFAAALSGCGHISYPRFLACDVVGTLVYAVLWVSLGHLFGEQLGGVLKHHARLLVFVVPTALAAVLAYRLWRRARYGPARPETVGSALACDEAA
jgi:membrane protein DedA with SNARE-associated domain